MGLATRIIPVILFGDTGAVKGQCFDHSRRIGSIQDRLRVIERRDVDELILLDVSATPNNRAPRFEQLEELCSNLFCPITVGGGIGSVSDIGRLLKNGADKCCMNTAAICSPELLTEASRKFGSQAIVASLDVRSGAIWSHCGARDTGHNPIEWARECEDRGAGEILLTSIDRDGTLQGYDLDLIHGVTSQVHIPVIAAGGCGTYDHMVQAVRAGAHAVAAGALWQFTESTPKEASAFLNDKGIATRC